MRHLVLCAALAACGVENPYEDGLPPLPDADPAAAPGTPPPSPTALNATAGEGAVTLRWQPAAGASSYRVRWSLEPGVERFNSAAAETPASPFMHSGLQAGVRYYYAVTAVRAGAESVPSNEVSVVPAEVVVLAPPGDVQASAGDARLTITWSPVAGASSYDVDIDTQSDMAFAARHPAVVSPYVITNGVYNGVTYYMRVTAVAGGRRSAPSAMVSATPGAEALGAPTGVTATPGDRSISVGWNAVAGATSYDVEIDDESTFTGATSFSDTASPLLIDAALYSPIANGTVYYLRVRADDGTAGAWSSTASATPQSAGDAMELNESFTGKTLTTLTNAGWTVTELAPSGDTESWLVGQDADRGSLGALDGDYLYADTWDAAETLSARLNTPLIALDANPVLRFDYAFADYGDILEVWVDDGTPSAVSGCPALAVTARTAWTCSLSSWANQSVRIGFAYTGNNDGYWHIDNLVIE